MPTPHKVKEVAQILQDMNEVLAESQYRFVLQYGGQYFALKDTKGIYSFPISVDADGLIEMEIH